MTVPGHRAGMPERLHLALAPDELGKTSSGRALQAGTKRPQPDDWS
jgi:hypothetical protein